VLVPDRRWLLRPTVLATWKGVGFQTSFPPKRRSGSLIESHIALAMYKSELCGFEMNEHKNAGDVLTREFVDASTAQLAECLGSLAGQTGAWQASLASKSRCVDVDVGHYALVRVIVRN
jgi:hypothetical protein